MVNKTRPHTSKKPVSKCIRCGPEHSTIRHYELEWAEDRTKAHADLDTVLTTIEEIFQTQIDGEFNSWTRYNRSIHLLPIMYVLQSINLKLNEDYK